MPYISRLKAIPEVQIKTALPEGLPEGKVAFVKTSPWNNPYWEAVLSAIATHAMRQNTWHAADYREISEIFLYNDCFMHLHVGKLLRAMWDLVEQDYINFVSVNGTADYIIPKEKIAQTLANCQLEWV